MVDNSTIGYLKQAIHDLQRSVNESNKTNRVLILSNLINSGVITKEEALKDPIYNEFVSSIKGTNSSNTIKAEIRRNR